MRKIILLVFALLLAIFFLFRGYWFDNLYLVANDYAGFSYPVKSFLQEALQNGRFDCWCPYQYGGQPLYAMPLWSPFYPVNLIFFFMPITEQLMWSAMFHLFLGGVFMFLWLRRLHLPFNSAFIGAFLFCFSPFVLQHVNEIDNVMRTIVWIPLLFYAGQVIIDGLEIVGSLLLALSMALMIMAGHMQFTFYAMVIFIIFYTYQSIFVLFHNRTTGRAIKLMISFTLVMSLAFGLSAIQLLPALYATNFITRSGGVSWHFATAHSLTPDQLINIFIPDFWHGWGMTDGISFPFLGAVVPLLFLVVMRYRRNHLTTFFMVMVPLSLLISAGKFTPVFYFLFHLVPGFNLFRGPSRFILIYIFFASTLAAYAVGILQDKRHNFRWLYGWLAVGIVLAVLMLIMVFCWPETVLDIMRKLILFAYQQLSVAQTRSIDYYLNRLQVNALHNTATALVFFIISLGGFGLALAGRFRLSRKVWHGCLAASLIFPSFLYAAKFISLGEAADYSPSKPLAEIIHTREATTPDYFRVGQFDYFIFNQGISLKLACLDGYGGFILNNVADFVGISEGFDPDRYIARARITLTKLTSPTLNLAAIKYIISHDPITDPLALRNLTWLANDDVHNLYLNHNAMPAIFPVAKISPVTKTDNVAFLQDESNYPLSVMTVPPSSSALAYADLIPAGSIATTTITPTSWLPDRREWRISAESPVYIVISENHYPLWQIEVDGKEWPMWKAYHYLIGTWVPAGDHDLVFRFVPWDLYLGVAATILASIIFLLVLYWACKRRLIHNIHDDENVLLDYLEHAPASLALVRGMEGKLFRRSKLTSPILDIGCGEGLFASIVFDQDIEVGIDLDIDELRKRSKPERYHSRCNANARGLPFKSSYFKTVISNCVFEHIRELDEPLQEIHRILQPGGKYVFTTHSHLYGDFLFYHDLCYRFGWYRLGDWYARNVNRVFRHYSMWSPQQWELELQKHGFHNIKFKYYLSRRAMHLFDLLLPGSIPARINKALWGKWAIMPRHFIAAMHTHILKEYYNEDPLIGAGLCIEAYK